MKRRFTDIFRTRLVLLFAAACMLVANSSCIIVGPCGQKDWEYCAEDGDCVCGNFCTYQSCDDPDRLCVAYDHEPEYGTCVNRDWAEEKGLRPMGALSDTEPLVESRPVDVAVPDGSDAGTEIYILVEREGYLGAGRLDLTIDHPSPSQLIVEVISPSGLRHEFSISELDSPSIPLEAFWDEPVAGDWTIRVVDPALGDSGTVEVVTLLLDVYQL